MRRPCLALLTLLLLGAPATAATEVAPLEGGARFKVTFKHQPVISANKVVVAGSFNGWSKSKAVMTDPDRDGTYTLTLTLPRGQHHYKFVINGKVWTHDADNPKTEPDGHSGFNSVLELGKRHAKSAGKRGDGVITMEEVIHDPAQLPFACAVDGRRRLVLRIHALRSDVEQVRVVASPRPAGAKGKEGLLARRIATWEGRDVYEARLTWSRAPRTVRYHFILEDGGKRSRLPAGKRKRFSLSMAKAGRFKTPEWVRDAVFYQIFPDRFRDGDPHTQPNLPKRPKNAGWRIGDRYLDKWGARPGHHNFMGGDLKGITQKVEYLASLGMNAIYLNPIFKAGSNHRYDASDYELIDPALGKIEDFHALRDACKKKGIRLLLDCVFNHTGDTHYAFQDAMKKGPKSKYWKWYFFDGGFPVVQSPKPNYRCWWGFGSLPQLNAKNPEVVKHLLGVGKKWLREGAAGWRLDVPNDLDHVNPKFWGEFRKQIKRQDPEAYIVGEIWTDARSWLKGDKFDAVMNYPVRTAALEFIVKGGIGAAAFRSKLSQQLATYPEPALRVQFNLLGSHDTARVLTLAHNSARRVRLAHTFLFSWLGAPVIYYGDEVGLTGGKDPGCRKAFPWNEAKQDKTTLAHIKKLGAVRKAERALRRGTVRFLYGHRRVSAFVREPERGERGSPIVCVLNADSVGATITIPAPDLKGSPVELIRGKPVKWNSAGKLELKLGPYEGALIKLLR